VACLSEVTDVDDENRRRYDRSEPAIPSAADGGMGVCGTVEFHRPSRAATSATSTVREVMNGYHVCLEHGIPVAGDPERLPGQHAVRHSIVELDRHAGPHPSRLYVECRGRWDAKPVRPPAIIDSKRESAEKGGLHRPHGYDPGKKIKGKKRKFSRYLGLLLPPSFIPPMSRIARCITLLATLSGTQPFLTSSLPTLPIRGRDSHSALTKICPPRNRIVKRSVRKEFVCCPTLDRRAHLAWLNRCRRPQGLEEPQSQGARILAS